MNSRWKDTGLPCPTPDDCNQKGRHPTSDAYCVDVDGGGYCFSCKSYFRGKEPVKFSEDELKQQALYFPHRGLTEETLRKFGTFCRVIDETPLEAVLNYPNGKKIRSLTKKAFTTTGDMSTPQLFGKDKFPAGSLRVVTITEGEHDAMAVYQMTNGSSACVSVRSSSSARVDLSHKPNYEYLNSFDKIIICFDNDKQGNLAADQVMGLFDFSKVYRLPLERFKDPNEYLLQEGKDYSKEFFQEWKSARKYTPDSLLSGQDDFRQALNKSIGKKICDYPIQSFNEMLKGQHEGEVVVWKGLEGIGKTELFRLVSDHVIKSTNIPIGIIHLEEDVSTTLQGIATYYLGESVVLDETGHSQDDVLEAVNKAVKGEEDRLVIYDSYDTDNVSVFIDNIRFMVKVLGCKVIFFDHISWLASNNDADSDERKFLDKLSQGLKTLAKELGFCLHMISHVNDDGKTRGSRNITKVADVVIDLTRDKSQNATYDDRMRTILHIEKARGRGRKDGPAGFLVFDPFTTTLSDSTGILN